MFLWNKELIYFTGTILVTPTDPRDRKIRLGRFVSMKQCHWSIFGETSETTNQIHRFLRLVYRELKDASVLTLVYWQHKDVSVSRLVYWEHKDVSVFKLVHCEHEDISVFRLVHCEHKDVSVFRLVHCKHRCC